MHTPPRDLLFSVCPEDGSCSFLRNFGSCANLYGVTGRFITTALRTSKRQLFISLLSQMTDLQNTDFARCSVVKCKTFWKILVFRDMTPCQSVVTDVSEELTCSIFRAQFVQEAWHLPTESDDLRYR